MSKAEKPKAARKRRPAPPFRGAFVVLWLASLTFAVYGGVGWLVTLWTISAPLAVMLAVAFAMAPLTAAALTGPAMRGGGLAAWSAVLVFCAMDAAGNVQAFWAFEDVAMKAENTARQEAHTAALLVYEADRKAASDLLAASSAALLALPDPVTACEGLGPVNCKARLDGIAASSATLTKQQDTAQRKLDGLVKPSAPEVARLLPMEATGIIHTLLSFALTAGFLGTHNARRKAEAMGAAERPKAKRRKSQRSKAPQVARPAPPRLVARDGEQLALF